MFGARLRELNRVADGHPGSRSSRLSRRGTSWWYFFPVVSATRAPLGLLILATIAAATAARWLGNMQRRQWLAMLIFPAAILGVAMASRIDLGVRHLLPIFLLAAAPLAFYAAQTSAAGID